MSSNMGINQQDFIEAFMVALEDKRGVNKLQGGMFQQLQKEIHHLTGNIQQKNERIAALEANQRILEKIRDALEQYSRRNTFRVSGLQELPNEDPVQLALAFCNFRLEVSPPITVEELDRVHRVGKVGSKCNLLIKFATYRSRNRVFAARSNLAPSHRRRPLGEPWRKPVEPQGSTSHDADDDDDTDTQEDQHREASDVGTPNNDKSNVDIPVDPDIAYAIKSFDNRTNIWINEDLTKTRATLLRKARMMKKNGGINDCWSVDGNIIIKNKFNKIKKIFDQGDLDKIN